MKDYTDIINKAIEIEESYVKEHEEILEILKSVEGKQINFKTFSEKVLKGFKLKSQYGNFSIVGKYEHFFGYRESIGVNIAEYERLDASHGTAAKERIEKLKNIDIEKVNVIFNKINDSFEALRSAFGDVVRNKLDSYNFPAYYEILRDISPKDEHIRLSDFYFIRK